MFRNDNDGLIDIDLGLSAQALAVAQLLARMSPEEGGALWNSERNAYEMVLETHAIYNGRERGICITVERTKARKTTYLFVAFGEVRNSDNIYIQAWVDNKKPYNGPTVADIPEESYDNRRTVSFGSCGAACKIIAQTMKKFMMTGKIS